ncbi:AsnC family transcriptional regulator [Burkholderia aenigmatica]|uniref:AsnC family transcriptional regulator n=2 Tax=Burkholderiaceae TaxID=119060 RepID=A0A6P2PWM3_9BURK|nr:AsnC family transcriptional regulator [Burkholderia aenigmatica]
MPMNQRSGNADMSNGELDRLDLSILEALQENARMPLSEVGRRIGLSQPATSERVKRLEERGIIAGYGARIDPAALGLGMMAIIRLKTTHEHIKPALRAFAEMPHVIEVHRMTGEDCFLLKVLVPTPGQLETIVDAIARFGAVTTSLVLRSEPAKPLGKALLG